MCILLYTHDKSNMATKEILWFGESSVTLCHTNPPTSTIYAKTSLTTLKRES